MTTIQQINSAIISGSFSNDELTSILDAIRFAEAQLGRQNKRKFMIGDRVKFTNSRSGFIESGTVTKIMVKNILVKTATSNWRVPANMLEAV